MDSGAHGGGFVWTAGGWFGSQLGATCWLFFAALSVMPERGAEGAALLGLFLAANAAGLALWLLRARISAYPALQLLIAIAAVSALAAIGLLEARGVWQAVNAAPGQPAELSAGGAALVVLAVFGAIAALLHGIHRRATR